MKRFLNALAAATVLLTAAPSPPVIVHASEKLELHVTPTVSLAPASVVVKAIVEHDANNRELEIVADSTAFYRRTVVELDGDHAPRTTELRLIDIPGGEYEVTATLYSASGDRTVVRKSITVMPQTIR